MALAEGQPVSVFYAPDFAGTDQDVKDLQAPKETRWCLLELPKEQLEQLEAGQTFRFQELSGAKGGAGFAALCTNNATFAVEFLENSNTILLGKMDSDESNADAASSGAAPAGTAAPRCTIFAQCRGQLIVKPEKVDTNKVREVLAPSALGQAQSSAQGLSTAALEYEVAASPVELQQLLKVGPYVEVEGVWRLLPAPLEREILDAAITIVTAMGWSHDAVDGEELLREVQNNLDRGEASVPTLAVLRKALASVMAVAGEGTAPTEQDSPATASLAGEQRLALDKGKMDLFRALHLLREPAQKVRDRFHLPPPEPAPAASKRPRLAGGAPAPAGSILQLEEFAAVYRELTGTEVDADGVMKILGDRAYVDEFEGTIHAIDASALPRDPNERLSRLFELQSHWRPERLAALVAPALAGVKVDPWLLKKARQVFVELVPGEELRMMVKKFEGI